MKKKRSWFADERIQYESYKFGYKTKNLMLFLIVADILYKILVLRSDYSAWQFEALAIVISYAYYITRSTLAGLLVLPDDAMERSKFEKGVLVTGVVGMVSAVLIYVYAYGGIFSLDFGPTELFWSLLGGFLVYLAIITGLFYLSKRRIDRMIGDQDQDPK